MTVWMIVLGVVAAWLAVSVVLALLVGRAIRLADREQGRRMAYRAAPALPREPIRRPVAQRAHARAS